MNWWDLYGTGIIILIVIIAVIAVVVAAFFILKKKLNKKMDDQKSMVNQHKVATSILVLEKKRVKLTGANVPKSVIEQVPKIYKLKKVPVVKAKIGPQVMDLLCDEAIFDDIPLRKTIRVDLAGIFIAGIIKGKK